MKKLIIVFVLLQVVIGFSQRPRGGQQPPRGASNQRSEQPQIKKFEASKRAGIIEYDVKRVLKKLKVKKSDSVAEKTTNAIEAFNTEIKKISITNKDLFAGLNVVINQNLEAAIKNKDREAVRSTMELAFSKLMPINTQIMKHETTLNAVLEQNLSEVQYKKWLEYQKSEKDKLIPKQKKKVDPRDKPSVRANAKNNIGFGR